MTPALEQGNVLDLKLRDPGWVPQRQLDDFIPDHNHLMHLYMIRWPAMDVVFHLHPEPTATASSSSRCPSVPAGTYHLYADVVHASGFPETIVGTVTLPAIAGRPLAGDDAEGAQLPWVRELRPRRVDQKKPETPRAALSALGRLHHGVAPASALIPESAGRLPLLTARSPGQTAGDMALCTWGCWDTRHL